MNIINLVENKIKFRIENKLWDSVNGGATKSVKFFVDYPVWMSVQKFAFGRPIRNSYSSKIIIKLTKYNL